MGLSTARHRRRLPVRDFLSGLVLTLLLWYIQRRPRKPWRATPAEVNRLGADMARLAWTAERLPLSVDYREHMIGVRQIEAYEVTT